MKERLFKRIVTVYFNIGVNIIGLPVMHQHQNALYMVGLSRKERKTKEPDRWLCF